MCLSAIDKFSFDDDFVYRKLASIRNDQGGEKRKLIQSNCFCGSPAARPCLTFTAGIAKDSINPRQSVSERLFYNPDLRNSN